MTECSKSIRYKIGKALKNQDSVTPNFSTDFHMSGHTVQKSHFGGFLTLIAKFYVWYIAGTFFYRMVTK